MVTQLAGEAGAYVIGTGRAADRQTALDFGAQEFVDLENDTLEDIGGVDLVFDVIGGDIQKRSAGLVRAGGTLVSIVGPAEARPVDGLAVDFVVVPDREIGRAHVCTPVTNAHLVCRLLLEKTKTTTQIHSYNN